MKNVLITGGAGYVGCVLTPQLLNAGYNVTVFDTFLYEKHLPSHPNLKLVEGDIREISKYKDMLKGIDVMLSLACVSNDASFELDEKLSTSVNLDAFEPMVLTAKNAGVKRFVYCSSSSVYGVSDKPEVTEDHPLMPVSLYNKYKGMCEPILWKHQGPNFTCVTIRPATVCGYSPRTRLDLSVNILTNHAVNNNKITVFGGSQLRPNLHIQDMCDLYQLLIELPAEKIAGQTFNAGYQNLSIMDIAKTVRKVVKEEYPEKGEIELVTTPSDDIRSYHINSDKIARIIGFKPKHTIEDAVRDLCKAFKAGKLPNSMTDDIYYNVRRMKRLEVK
jgi:nucleoside-diphosphate-sugar epimerase